MRLLELQYFTLVFVASCGLLQGVFTYRRVSGLQFFRSPALGYVFAVFFFVGSFVWFFSDERDLPPLVIEGSQQTVLFVAASALSVYFTYVLSFLIRSVRPSTTMALIAGEHGKRQPEQPTYNKRLPSVCRYVRHMILRLAGQGADR